MQENGRSCHGCGHDRGCCGGERRSRGGEVIVVGYAFMAKKMGTMAKIVQDNSAEAQEKEQGPRVVFTPLDLDTPLEEQAPFDVILHKLSEDVMLRDVQPESGRRVAALENYVRHHPEVVLVEHPRDIGKIVSRAETCRVLKRMCEELPDAAVRPPRFVVVDKRDADRTELSAMVAKAPFSYPIMCKPVAACGSSGSHKLIVVGNEEGLSLVPSPVVLQEYYNHDGVLFKVYVLGVDSIKVFRRASLPNLGPNARNLAFDSQQPYPSGKDFGNDDWEGVDGDGGGDEEQQRRPSSPSPSPPERSHIAGLDGNGDASCRHSNHDSTGTAITANLINGTTPCCQQEAPQQPARHHHHVCRCPPASSVPYVSEDRIRLAARQLSQTFHLEVFGFDVIVDKATGDLVVVDVNYFPSFKEMPDFPARLRAFLRRKAAGVATSSRRGGQRRCYSGDQDTTQESVSLPSPPPAPP